RELFGAAKTERGGQMPGAGFATSPWFGRYWAGYDLGGGRLGAANSRTGSPAMKETVWLRLIHGVRRLRQRADWLPFVGPDWADHIMRLVIWDRFHAKQGRSIARWALRNENRDLTVYLKRHYRLSRWRGLLATVWPDAGWSPALQEWQHLQWAEALGM